MQPAQAAKRSYTLEELVPVSRVRMPSPESVAKLKKDPAFDYTVKPPPESWWDRFWRWLDKVLHLHRAKNPFWIFTQSYFWYIIFGLTVAFVIYKIFKSDIIAFFYRSRAVPIHMQALEEDINEIDFEAQISEAVKQRQYKYAIRLYYLKSLKTLYDRNLIDWKIDKTNREYQQELYGTAYHQPFASITSLFNWVWYGDAEVTENDFQNFQAGFIQFNAQFAQSRK